MSEILFQYERVNPTTWAYLASLLVIALYFKFSRIWSVRNLDLIGLILLAPALLMVKYGLDYAAAADDAAGAERARLVEHIGYIWLFALSGLFLLRLLLDAAMVRRPLLEPNLSVGGLTFPRHLAVCVLDGERCHRDAGRGRCHWLATGRSTQCDDCVGAALQFAGHARSRLSAVLSVAAHFHAMIVGRRWRRNGGRRCRRTAGRRCHRSGDGDPVASWRSSSAWCLSAFGISTISRRASRRRRSICCCPTRRCGPEA